MRLPPPPLHTLAVLWFHFKFEGRIDPLALVISSTIVDLEPFLVLTFGLQLPIHGFWHSYLGVFLLSFPLTLSVYIIETRFSKVVEKGYRLLRIDSARARHPLRIVLYSSLIGGFSHVFFDMFTHKSFPHVLYPLFGFSNPFWLGSEVAVFVETLVVFLSVYSCWLVVKTFLK